MTAGDESDDPHRGDAVIPFPFSRVKPLKTASDDEPACYGAIAVALKIPHEQTTGHWCSRCAKIWYGYLLEVTCPTCGNRHG